MSSLLFTRKTSLFFSMIIIFILTSSQVSNALIVNSDSVSRKGEIGRFTSIALDDSGNPHISFQDFSNGDLKYATKTEGSWNIETVDSTGEVG